MLRDWFASTWQTAAYVAASTTAIYCSVLLAVRVAGRRTVARLSAFDVVVTISLGSVVASTAVSREPTYAQGMTATATLLLLQVAAGALRQRFALMRRLLDFRPYVVVRDGEQRLSTTPLGPQVSEDELWSMLREQGVFRLDGIRLVMIEPTGGVSIVRDGDDVPVEAEGGDGPPVPTRVRKAGP